MNWNWICNHYGQIALVWGTFSLYLYDNSPKPKLWLFFTQAISWPFQVASLMLYSLVNLLLYLKYILIGDDEEDEDDDDNAWS